MSSSIYKSINLYQILYIFILIPFIVPGYLNNFPIIYILYRVFLIFSFFIIFILYIRQFNKNIFIPIVFLYAIVRLLSALINETFSFNLIIDLLRVTSICMLVDYVITKKKYREWLSSITILFRILLVINLILLILFPEGLALGRWDSRINFLGSDNTVATLLIPMIPLVILSSKVNNYKLKYLDLCIILATLLLTWSGTGIAGLILLGGYILLSVKFQWLRTLNVWGALMAIVGVFVSIILFRVQYLFAFFIEDFLKKDLTFTNRTNVWDKAIELINLQFEEMILFLFGYGHRKVNIIYDITNGLYAHAHNEFLGIILESGFLGLALFLTLLVLCINKLSKNSHIESSVILMASIFSITIMSIFDSNFTIIFFILLTISYNIQRIEKSLKVNKEKITV